MEPQVTATNASAPPSRISISWKWWLVAIGLIALIGLAIALRMPAFDRPPQLDFQFGLYQDERKMLNNTLRVMQGKPLLPHWPYGIYRILEPQFQFLRLVHTLRYKERLWPPLTIGEFRETTRYEMHSTFILLRSNALAFGLGIVALTFLLARRIGGNTGGLIAAFVVAITPLMVAYSRMMYYDIVMVFFFLLYLYVFARSFESHSVKNVYAAVALSAITFTMKQNAAILFVMNIPLVIGVVGGWRLIAVFRSLHTYLLMVLFFAVVAVGYPTLLSLEGIAGFANNASLMYFTGSESQAFFSDRRLWVRWLTSHWPTQAPVAIFFFLAAGLAIGAYFGRSRIFGFAVLAGGLLYYVIAGYSTHNVRTLLPLIPLLAIGLAGWTAWMRTWHRQALARVALVGAVVFVAVPLLTNTVRLNLLVTLQDTRIQTLQWLAANARDGDKIAREPYTPHVPTIPERLGEHVRADPRQKAFEAVGHRSLIGLAPGAYPARGYDYLLHARGNYEMLKRHQAAGDVISRADLSRIRTGKNVRFGFVVDEALARYDRLEELFPVVATFRPAPPPDSLRRAEGQLQESLVADADEDDDLNHDGETEGGFFASPVAQGVQGTLDALFAGWWDPNVFRLWREHDRYVLGHEIVIYRVSRE